MSPKNNSGDNEHRFIKFSSLQNGSNNDKKASSGDRKKAPSSNLPARNYKYKSANTDLGTKTNTSQIKKKPKTIKNKRKCYSIVIVVWGRVLTFWLFIRKNGYAVTIGEKELGIIKKEKNIEEDIMSTVKAQIETERGTTIQFVDEVKFTPVRIKSKAATTDYIITEIRNNVAYNVSAAVIVVDGNDAAVVNNKTEAETLLNEIIDEYIPEGSKIDREKSGFVQTVEVVEKFVDSSEISTPEQVKEKFLSGNKVIKPYTVQRGDTLSKIAAERDMEYKEILDLNPTVTEKTLIAGHQISVYQLVPFLSVRTTETVSFIEKELKKVEYRDDSSLKKGTQKVIQQGKDGQKEVISQIIRVNGFEESSQVIEEKILVEPVTEIIAVGTA